MKTEMISLDSPPESPPPKSLDQGADLFIDLLRAYKRFIANKISVLELHVVRAKWLNWAATSHNPVVMNVLTVEPEEIRAKRIAQEEDICRQLDDHCTAFLRSAGYSDGTIFRLLTKEYGYGDDEVLNKAQAFFLATADLRISDAGHLLELAMTKVKERNKRKQRSLAGKKSKKKQWAQEVAEYLVAQNPGITDKQLWISIEGDAETHYIGTQIWDIRQGATNTGTDAIVAYVGDNQYTMSWENFIKRYYRPAKR
jgi:hypothetical protein